MSEPTEVAPRAWFLRCGGEGTEVRQLPEDRLRAELRRAGDRIGDWWVRQGDGNWHPADAVEKKFRRLEQEGIYIRRDGNVEGPYTAGKTVEVLTDIDLTDVDAKVGIHADWFDAVKLLRRLQAISRGDQTASPQAPAETPTVEAIVVGQEDNESDIPFVDAVVLPEIELVLVAEPVAAAPAPVSEVEVRPSISRPQPTQRRRRSTPAAASTSRSGGAMLWVGLAMASLLIVVGGVVVVAFRESIFSPVAERDANAPGSGTTANATGGANSVGAGGPATTGGGAEEQATGLATAADPPTVRAGMLYRPAMRTTIGEARGGTLFAARVGRSNRVVLVGAVHLLGPATGLPRQLRGAEVLMNWRGLTVVDCVSGESQEVEVTPIRMRTAEYPSISVHGDALALEPNQPMGLDPIAVGSGIPTEGDRIWLLAPAIGTDQLVHPGRWVGVEDDWYIYRLDNQQLELTGTSGGAVLDDQHRVVGIHVAGGETPGGVFSIASPIKAIVREIR